MKPAEVESPAPAPITTASAPRSASPRRSTAPEEAPVDVRVLVFENIENQIKLATPADIQEIKLELQEQGYIKKKKSGKKQRKVKVSAPEEFHTSDGTTVLVGKNNLQNDRLSFKIANKNEIWLHVKDIPGSHVVIRSTNPSEDTILEAAQLAAYFSKGRDSDNVPVDYLPVKRLHKPNGAKPGFVIFTGQKTLYVTPHKLSN